MSASGSCKMIRSSPALAFGRAEEDATESSCASSDHQVPPTSASNIRLLAAGLTAQQRLGVPVIGFDLLRLFFRPPAAAFSPQLDPNGDLHKGSPVHFLHQPDLHAVLASLQDHVKLRLCDLGQHLLDVRLGYGSRAVHLRQQVDEDMFPDPLSGLAQAAHGLR
eukprot:CAMPEP_0115570670 /NCGR_PEP_ID=MMETSP0271-20121206/105821_1 /TAXON_ID=71861 /ORGANISM="Scrippsiella trochoidea, Strain CCMP3099" /LENGTH=163 /DNA_ID=CAMNT_0003005219 /DNA_START=322 /DNA_END=814 /DNA_ORIENTATION=+